MLVILSCLINSISLIMLFILLRRLNRLSVPADVPTTEDVPTEDISLDLQERVEFTERINRLKEEIAESNFKRDTVRHGVVADELHPDVYNLPHDSVRQFDVLPDVEVSE